MPRTEEGQRDIIHEGHGSCILISELHVPSFPYLENTPSWPISVAMATRGNQGLQSLSCLTGFKDKEVKA